ncbi:MAG TPA: hypothetical protein VFT67_08990 [Jatrophihabitantaceae bacterium]|nr:hypothetical protein [Jatrophihabitantaceae bacterium]
MTHGIARSAAHHDLDLIFAAVDTLDALAADPDAADDRARIYDFSIRWGVLLAGRLHRLEHFASLGALNTEERERYDVLVERLRGASSAAERLGLTRPKLVDG